MLLASMMGAVAFQKGLGIVHSLAHPLSTLLDVHHGLANAIMITYGMEFNMPGLELKFQEFARALKLDNTTNPESVLTAFKRFKSENWNSRKAN